MSAPTPRPTALSVDIDAIPTEFRGGNRWVCWDWWWDPNRGAWTKPPRDARSGAKASSTDPTTWCDLPSAVAAMGRRQWAGIGRVLVPADRLVGVDLDTCRNPETGVLQPWATEIVADCSTYAEVSPSGTGIRLWLRGDLPALLPGGRLGARRGPIEVYAGGRYLTVTGHRLPDAPSRIAEGPEALRALVVRVSDPRTERPDGIGGSSPSLSDEEVLARCRDAANGPKFRALWAGDTAGHGGDGSAADLALLGLLTFWTQDADQLDRLFRRSGLCRPKWTERSDYRARTLAKALDRAETWAPARTVTVARRGGTDPVAAATEAEPPTWEEPLPLADPPRPAFPTDLLPPALRAFVATLAHATQTPPALAALLCLAVLAAAAAKRVAVRVRAGWIEPVNVYVVGALPPGERKSAVFAEAVAPLEAWEAAEAARLGPEVAEAATQAKINEKRLEKLRHAAANEDDPLKRAELSRGAAELAQALAAEPVPELPRLLVDDCSPERLASLMSRHGGRIAAMSAEGGLFDIMAGRYAKDASPNLDVFLKGHSGDAIRVDRVGRAPEFVRAPALTLALAVQPEVIRGLAGRSGFRGRGLLARVWFALPESLVGHRQINPPPVPDAARESYTALIRHVLGLRPLTAADGSPQARELAFGPKAAAVHLAFEAALEPRLGEFGELAHAADWGGKLAGAVARLAGILHLAAWPRDDAPWERPISEETMRAAVAIAEGFLAPHALAAFAAMGADPALEDARHVLGWLGRTDAMEVSRRDLRANLPKRFRDDAHLDGALRLLAEHGYLREVAPERGGGPGRPASTRYAVNSLWRPRNPQNPQNGVAEEGFVDSVDFVDGLGHSPDLPDRGFVDSVDFVDVFRGEDHGDEDEFAGWDHVGEGLL